MFGVHLIRRSAYPHIGGQADRLPRPGGSRGSQRVHAHMNVLTQSPQNIKDNAPAIQIAGLDLQFSPHPTPDGSPSGRQIAIESGFGDPTELIVLHWLPNGLINEVGLDESVEVLPNTGSRFIVTRSDRSYRFELNGLRNEWPVPVLTGAVLKRLAGNSGDYDVFQEREVEADIELSDEDPVHLDDQGVERFYTKKSKLLTIYVNNRDVEMRKGRYTGAEIKATAIAQAVQIQMDFLLSLIRNDGGEDVIGDDDKVKVKDGMRFSAVADDDASME